MQVSFHVSHVRDWRHYQGNTVDPVIPITAGRGTAYGHHGEVLQGVFEQESRLQRGLVTLPCPTFKSTAVFRPDGSNELSIFPADRTKALQAARIFAVRRGQEALGGSIVIDSNTPIGFGFGSSTSDIVAAVRAVADGMSQSTSAEEIARIAVAAEVASDATMFDGQAVLFAQRAGEVIEYFGRSLPALHILSVNTAPEAPVDTVSLHAARYTSAEIEAFRPLRAMLRLAVRNQDARLVGRVATASAKICQRHLAHSRFIEIGAIADRTHAIGLQVSHSGTVVGVLYDANASSSLQFAHQAVTELATLGLSSSFYLAT